MLMFNKLFQLFFQSDSGGGGAITAEDNTEEIINLLGQEEDKTPPLELKPSKDKEKEKVEEKEEETEEEETEEKEEEEEEIDELAEIEEEIEEPDAEKLELVTPVRRADILKKYPTLFKDFPYLETAYFRERKFSEIYSTIDDAKEASEKANALDGFEEALLKGETKEVLASIKNVDKNAFLKIVDNYLPTLGEVDPQAYTHVVGTIIKDAVKTLYDSGTESDNDALKNAAAIIQQFFFNTTKWTPPQKLSREVKENPEEKRIQEREQVLIRQQFENARDGLNTKVDKIIKSTIEGYIDPKKSMTDYVKKNATREALETTERIISNDSRFRLILDKLWQYAYKNNFNKESVKKIEDAYLSKAKTVLPSVIKKARNEALKGLGKRVKEEEKEEPESSSEKRRSTPPSNSGRISDKGKEKGKIPEGMSNTDYLMSD